MTTQSTAAAPQWAIIELMGHVRYGGLVSKDNQFGTAMLRVAARQGNSEPMQQWTLQHLLPSSVSTEVDAATIDDDDLPY